MLSTILLQLTLVHTEKSSDGGIFTHSNLGKAIEQDKLRIPRSVKLPNTSIEVPYYIVIVGDEAFPLKTYL